MADSIFTRVTRQKPIRSVSVSLHDLKAIARVVFDRNQEAVELERAFIQRLQVDDKTRQEYFDIVEQNQKMTIFVNGKDGDNLVVYDPNVFDSHLLPSEIISVTIESQTHRRVRTNADPPNYLRVHFDFSKLIFSSPKFTPSGALLNISMLQIEGNNEAWVVSTYRAVEDRLKSARNARSFLHGDATYQFSLYLIVFPVAVIVLDEVYRGHQSVFDNLGPIVKIGALAYCILLTAISYRLFFNYALWVFPTVELANERDRSTRHRKFWFTIVTGLIVSAIGYFTFKK